MGLVEKFERSLPDNDARTRFHGNHIDSTFKNTLESFYTVRRKVQTEDEKCSTR